MPTRLWITLQWIFATTIQSQFATTTVASPSQAILELARLRRIVSGNFYQETQWPGVAFESANCDHHPNECACTLQQSDTTIALSCGKGHVLCSFEFASYGNIRGKCGDTSAETRALQEGSCKMSDSGSSGISARTILREKCEGMQQCLLNRCMMAPPNVPLPDCMRENNNLTSWGTIVQQCTPINECSFNNIVNRPRTNNPAPADTIPEKTAAGTPNQPEYLLASSLQTDAPMEFHFTQEQNTEQRTKACPHIVDCPSCVCSFEPETMVAAVKPIIVFTIPPPPPTAVEGRTNGIGIGIGSNNNNNKNQILKLWLECTGQLPLASRLSIASSSNDLLAAGFDATEYQRMGANELHRGSTEQCGGSFIPLYFEPQVATMNKLSSSLDLMSNAVTVSLFEKKVLMGDIHFTLERPPKVTFGVRSARADDDDQVDATDASDSLDDSLQSTCILTVGKRTYIDITTNGVFPTTIEARSGQPQTLPDKDLDLQNGSFVKEGARSIQTSRLHIVASQSGLVAVHVVAIDGNGIQVTETLTCKARKPPMITMIDESPIIVTVGFGRIVKYVVDGHVPLNLRVTSRVANVLADTDLKYTQRLTNLETETVQLLEIAPPQPNQVGTTSFNITIEDGNGARTESLDVVCQIVSQPSILLRHTQVTITKEHAQIIPIVINGYNVQTLQVTSSNPLVLPDSMVVLQQNDDKSYEIHVTGKNEGKTTIEFVAIDANGASSLPNKLRVVVLSPPTIEIVDQRNVVLVIVGNSNVLRGSNVVEAMVGGFEPIDVVSLSSNLEVVNPSKGDLKIEGSGGKRTITVNKLQANAGSAVVRLIATDGNGASASVDFQVDIIQEKAKSKHQLWQERRNKNSL